MVNNIIWLRYFENRVKSTQVIYISMAISSFYVMYVQVKLSGRGDKPVLDWAGKGILATSTGEGVIR